MEAILGRMDGKFQAFMKDSTMMRIVNYAMDKAHEKVKSKEGVIERLNEISKFYQLAVMQLEVCMKFVEDEADSIPESNHEDVLVGLREIRDRLQGRLIESELAISEKDTELAERLENELKLMQALDQREKEIASLRKMLELERTKSECVEPILSSQGSWEEEMDGEFSELRNSVDQQVLNIKLKLEPEHEPENDQKFRNIDNTKIEQMGSDIDVLKQTMDLAFNKMQDAIFLSEMGPLEQQWRWTIERDIITILIRCFMEDFQKNFGSEMRNREKKISTGLSDQFSELMNDVTELRNELENLNNQCETQSKNTKGAESLASGEKSLSESKNEDGSNFVAKLIKNHETIIKKKSVEKNLVLKELLRAKGSNTKNEPDTTKRRIQDVIAKMDDFMKWNNKLGEANCSFNRAGNEDVKAEKRAGIYSFEDVWQRLNKKPVSDPANKQLREEIAFLKQEKEDTNFQNMILEEINATAFRSLINEFNNELCDRDLDNFTREIMYQGMAKDIADKWNEKIEINNIEVEIREKIHHIVLRETMNNISSTHELFLENLTRESMYQGMAKDAADKWIEKIETDYIEVEMRAKIYETVLRETMKNICLTVLFDDLEGILCGNLWMVLFQEMYKDWNEVLESYIYDQNVKEEVFQIVLDENIRDVLNSAEHTTTLKVAAVKAPGIIESKESFESEEHSLQVDIYLVFIREMLREWHFDIDAYQFGSFIREEIHQFVVLEAVNEARTRFNELEPQFQHKVSSGFPHERRESSGVEYMIQTIETLIKCFEAGEELVFKASSEIQEHSVNLDLVGSELAELDEYNIFQELLTEEKNTSISVISKLEKALHHLTMSREVLSELGSSLGIPVDDQMSIVSSTVDEKDFSIWKGKEVDELNLIPSESDLFASPVLEFSQQVMSLQCAAHQKLQMNSMRLDKCKNNLDQLIENASSLRQENALYKNAFTRRCQNLLKAEIEVDLLGDQVDSLLGLLEKTYRTIKQHSPVVLKQSLEVSEIMRLIKKELNGGVHA